MKNDIIVAKKTRSLQVGNNRPLLVSTGVSTMTLITEDYSFLPSGVQYIKSTAIVLNSITNHNAGIYYTIDGSTWVLYSNVFSLTDLATTVSAEIEAQLQANQGLLDVLNELKAAIDNDESAIDAINNVLALKVDKVTGKVLSTNDYTTIEKNKLAGLSNYDDTTIITAITNGLANKVDKVSGYGLSKNDYIDVDKTKINNLKALAYLDTITVSLITDFPIIPTLLSDLTDDDTHRTVTDIEKGIWNSKLDSIFVPTLLSDLTDDNTHRLVTDSEISNWNNKANKVTMVTSGNFAGLTSLGDLVDSTYNYLSFDLVGAATAAQNNAATYTDNSIIALKDGVSTSGNTLLKLYNLVTGGFAQVNVADITARNAYNVISLPFQIFVQDIGSGHWGLYNANQTGTSSNFTLISDYTTFNSIMSAPAIKSAYESNADTNAFTNADATKLSGLSNYTLLIATTSILGGVKSDGVTINIDGTGVISVVAGSVTLSQTIPQTIGTTTNRLLKLWATDITVTNSIVGSVTGSAATWTTARNLAGNSVNGSANVAFANKFIVQGTTDSGLSGAQFLGALGTGIVKNTTTTGVLSIAIAADFPTLNQNTTGTATKATNLVGGNNTTLLGSIPYQSNTNVTTLLSPNITTTKKYLSLTGTGTNGAVPVWDIGYVLPTATNTVLGGIKVGTSLTINAGVLDTISSAYAALTGSSPYTWACSGGLNRTVTLTGNITLSITGATSGMEGDLIITVSSGTPTITLSDTHRLNGNISTLTNGVYHLCWKYSTLFDFNIALYS